MVLVGCVVEVEGGRRGGLTTACTAHCQEDMVVATHSEKLLIQTFYS